MRPIPLLLPLAAAALPTLAAAQTTYQGAGYAQRLDPLPGAAVLALEVARVDADPRPDLFYLLDDGRLLAERNVADQGRQETAATGVDALAVVRTAAGERVLLSVGGGLCELTWSAGSFATSPIAGSAGWGGEFLRAVRTGAGGVPGVLSIAAGGTAVRCVDLVGGSWQLAQTITPAAPETGLLQADVLEWGGVEVVATLGTLGLTLHQLSNGAPLVLDPTAPVPTFACDPAGAHITVLEAERNVLAQDLLCWQRVIAGAPPSHTMGLLIFNATHMELLATDPLDLRQAALVDFLGDGDGLAELVLSDPTARTVYFARQSLPLPGNPIFWLETDPYWTIDLTQIDTGTPPSPWPVVPCVIAPGEHDLDGDGLADLAFTTPLDHLCVLPGESASASALERPQPQYEGPPQLLDAGSSRRLRYESSTPVPAWAAEIEIEAWHRRSSFEPARPDPLTRLTPGSGPSLGDIEVEFLTPGFAILEGDYESFFLQLRFVDADGHAGPTTTLVWTPSSSHEPQVFTEHFGSYAWIAGTSIGGGTVGGPRVRPLDTSGGGG